MLLIRKSGRPASSSAYGITEANGWPGCRRDSVASVPVRPRYASVRARSAKVGSGTVGGSGPGGGPAWRLTGLHSDESRTVWNHRETRVGRGDQRSGRATVARRATATMRPAPPNKTKRGPDRPQDDAPRASAGQSANQ